MSFAFYNWQQAPESLLSQYDHVSPYLAGFEQWVLGNIGGQHLGDYDHRRITGGGPWSTHAFGAAWDWGAPSRDVGLALVDRIIANPQAYGIQSIHDYQGGRIWHFGRGWKPYTFPPGDANDSHFHFEISNSVWNSVYQAPSGRNPATPSVLSREQTAQILYQAGFRGDALWKMVAIAGRESSYRPNAHRTDQRPEDMSGDRGLFQINYVHDERLMRAGIITNPRDLFDPVVNARAAFFLSGGGSEAALGQLWGAGPNGWNGQGNYLYGTDPDAAREAVENARASGLLGQNWSPGGSYPGDGGPGGRRGVGPMELPRDAQLVRNGRGLFAMFNLGRGVFISYRVPQDGSVIYDRSEVVQMSDEKMRERFGRFVDGGNANELAAIHDEWGTYKSFWENVLIENLGLNNPARNDPGVRRVLAMYAARPDMSPQELQNRLEGTRWWKQRTEAELAWNDLSPAEKEKRRQDTAVQMAQIWYQLTGRQAQVGDMMDNRWVDDIASGKITIGFWSESVVKKRAAELPNSPWSRSVRDEKEAQRQRGIDVENTANQIKDTLTQWGLRWDQKTISRWAEGIMEKRLSDEDLMNHVKEQATALYPLKDPEMDTTTYAQPWMQAFSQLMEREATLFTPRVAKALQSGETVWDMQQQLRNSQEWLSTRNGQAEMDDNFQQLGEMFGYA